MSKRAKSWAIAVHGGAKEIAPDEEDANRAGCLLALARGREVLADGGTAVQAVEAAIRALEDDPTFNAGCGSVPKSDGSIAMDAALMDGATLDVGGVGALRGVRHPITVARMMLSEFPVLLVADGARAFADEHGAELAVDESPIHGLGTRSIRRDTVGCVALDRDGHAASGTSTGGVQGAPPGRVGDSPIPGAGLYAEDGRGAVAFSGDGESIVRLTLASQVMSRLPAEGPRAAVHTAVASLERIGGEAGGIALHADGRIGWAHTGPNFAVAYMTSDMAAPQVFLRNNGESVRFDD